MLMVKELVAVSVCWIVALFIFLVLGAGIMRLLKMKEIEERPLYQVLLQALAGMAVLNTAFGVVSLFAPITLSVTASLGIVAVLMLSFDSKTRKIVGRNIKAILGLSWYTNIIILVLLVLVVITTLLPSLNYDTGLYHNQFVMWINRYPVVSGLANLHERFGFNSHWQLLAAGFNGYHLLDHLLDDMGALLTIVILLAWTESVERVFKNNHEFFDSLIILFVVPLYLLARFLTSDTPDLPNSILGFTLLSIPFCTQISAHSRLYFMAIVGGLLVTIKVSSVLLLVSAVPSLFKIKFSQFSVALLLGVLILTPWMMRNYQMGGYLVYPAKFTAIGSPDFQAPVESLEYVNALLESHGRFGYYDVTLVDRPVSEWAETWVARQTTAIKLILAFCFLLLFPMLIYDIVQLIRSKWEYRFMLAVTIHLAFFLSMLIVFKLAPEIRYGYGSLLFYFVYLLLRCGANKSRVLQLGLATLGLLMFVRIVLVIRNEPPAPVLSKTYSKMDGSALPIFYPNEFDQCWEHQLPCANRYIEGLEMRTDKLEDGFRIVKP